MRFEGLPPRIGRLSALIGLWALACASPAQPGATAPDAIAGAHAPAKARLDPSQAKASPKPAGKLSEVSRAGETWEQSLRAEFLELRGYDAPADLRLLWVGPEQWPPLLTRELDSLMPESVGRELDQALIAFGLLPEGYDSRAETLKELQKTLAGLYLTSSQEMALPALPLSEIRRSSVLHEMTHAHQDRLHGIGQRLRYRPGRSDEISALHALAEGEALVVEMLAAQRGVASPTLISAEELEAVFATASEKLELPAAMRRSLVAPYLDGYRLVAEAWSIGGWPLVDRIWARGLQSTRELLHPEAWLNSCASGDCAEPTAPEPLPSSPPPLGDASAELRFADSFGEQGLRLVLEESLPKPQAADLARHLRADRLSVYALPTGRSIRWQIALNDAQAARPICQSLRDILSRGSQGRSTSICIERATTVGTVACRDDDILILFHRRADTWTAKLAASDCAWLRRVTAATFGN